MLALKEFANFINLSLADLALNYAQLLAEKNQDYAVFSERSRIASGRKLLKAVAQSCQEQSSDPLVNLFRAQPQQGTLRWAEDITPPHPAIEAECLGLILTEVVPNLDASKFLWQLLSDVRAVISPPKQSLIPAKALPADNISVTPKQQLQMDDQLRLFTHIVENSQVAQIALDKDKKISYVNPFFCNLYGYKSSEILGHSLSMLSGQAEPEAYISSAFEVVNQKGVWRDDDLRKQKDDTTFPASVSITEIKDETGQVVAYLDVSRDITSRKDTQKIKLAQTKTGLLASEEKYKTILNNIEDGYFEVDLAGNLTFFNDTLAKLFGYPADQLMGMNNREYTDEANAKKLYKMFSRIYTTGQPARNVEWQLTKLDSSQAFIETSASLIKDINGEAIGFRGVTRDITERKQMDETIRTSEEHYRLLLEASPDAIVLYDIEGNATYVNPSFTRVFGWAADEILGKRIDFVPEENMPEIKIALGQLFEKGYIQEFETKRLTKDGYILEVQQSGAVIKDQAGNVTGSVIFIQDITKRKQVEEELYKLSRAVEQSSSTVVITDTKGYIEYVNPSFVKTTGYTLDEALGQHTRILKSGTIPDAGYANLWQTIAAGKEWRGEFNNKRKTGELYWESAVISPIKNSAGKITHFLAVKEEISEQKRSERILANRAIQLEAVAQISTAASTILDENQLLNKAVNLIRDKFDFYYVDLFLVDEAREWVDLQAGTGEAGRIQLEQNYRLQIGGDSIIGWSVKNKQARIALDVGKDAVRFENPILPKTRSEMAIPLISRGEALGALTIQSTAQNAFTNEDISVLQVMADQLAITIANTRLFEGIQARSAQLELISQIEGNLALVTSEAEILTALAQGLPQQPDRLVLLYIETDQNDHPLFLEKVAIWQDGVIHRDDLALSQRYSFDEFSMNNLFVETPNEIVFIVDTMTDARVDEAARQLFSTLEVATTASIPLRSGNRWQGLLTFDWRTPHEFSRAEQFIFRQLMEPIAANVASRRATLAQEVALAETESLYKITHTLAELSDQREMAEAALTQYLQLLNMQQGGVLLYDDDFAMGTLIAHVKNGVLIEPGTRIQITGNPINKLLIETKQPVVVTDVFTDPRLGQSRELVEKLGFRAILMVPILIQGQVIGSLGADSPDSIYKFSDRAIDFVKTVTDRLGVAFENQRLFQQTQRRAQQEQILREITDKMRAAISLDELVKITAQELGDYLAAGHTLLELGVKQSHHQPVNGDHKNPYRS